MSQQGEDNCLKCTLKHSEELTCEAAIAKISRRNSKALANYEAKLTVNDRRITDIEARYEIRMDNVKTNTQNVRKLEARIEKLEQQAQDLIASIVSLTIDRVNNTQELSQAEVEEIYEEATKLSAKKVTFKLDEPHAQESEPIRVPEPSRAQKQIADTATKESQTIGIPRPLITSNNVNNYGSPDRFTIDVIVEINDGVEKKTLSLNMPMQSMARDLYQEVRREMDWPADKKFSLIYLRHAAINEYSHRTLWSYGFRHIPNHVASIDEEINTGDQIRVAYAGKGPNVNY